MTIPLPPPPDPRRHKVQVMMTEKEWAKLEKLAKRRGQAPSYLVYLLFKGALGRVPD